MNQKTVVVIPGSAWQIPIIKKIRSLGYRALVVNPYDDSPAFSYADGYLKSDMFDKDTVISYCRKNNADAIMSEECDIAMPALAEYGKILGLSVLSEEDAHLFTDKYAMRDFCMEHNIPTPEYKLCYSEEEAISFFNELNKKMIIKPLDSNSSRGVFTIETVDDIKEHFDEALSYSKVKKAVLMERYIDGTEFTIDGIKTPQKHFSLAISEKRHFKHNINIASELYFTHKNENYDYELLKKTNDAFVNASNLKFGLTHAEYKYCEGKFYLIEIAARGGGNLISADIVPFMSGIDNYSYLIDCSLGKVSSPEFDVKEEYMQRAAVLKFFETPENGGIVEKIEGIDFLEKNPSIKSFKFNFEIGDKIEPAKNDAARVGFYIGFADNAVKLNELIDSVSSHVQFICSKG